MCNYSDVSGFNSAITLKILTTKRQHMHAINNKDFHYTFKCRKHITNTSQTRVARSQAALKFKFSSVVI